MVVHEPSALEEQDSVSEAVTLDDNTKAKLEAEICSLKCENAQLKSRVQQLQTTLQRLDPRFLSPSQLQMYTGLGKVEFGCLASWLSKSVGRRSASPLPTSTSAESTHILSETIDGINENKADSYSR